MEGRLGKTSEVNGLLLSQCQESSWTVETVLCPDWRSRLRGCFRLTGLGAERNKEWKQEREGEKLIGVGDNSCKR